MSRPSLVLAFFIAPGMQPMLPSKPSPYVDSPCFVVTMVIMNYVHGLWSKKYISVGVVYIRRFHVNFMY